MVLVAVVLVAAHSVCPGKICAIQLDYHEAHVNLSQALRKAPQSTGRSFRIAIQQLSCIVQMLMGAFLSCCARKLGASVLERVEISEHAITIVTASPQAFSQLVFDNHYFTSVSFCKKN